MGQALYIEKWLGVRVVRSRRPVLASEYVYFVLWEHPTNLCDREETFYWASSLTTQAHST